MKAMRLCWPGHNPFRALYVLGGGGLVGCVQSRELCARTPRLPRLASPRLVLLVNFSDTLLVFSILKIVYDCYLRLLLQF